MKDLIGMSWTFIIKCWSDSKSAILDKFTKPMKAYVFIQ